MSTLEKSRIEELTRIALGPILNKYDFDEDDLYNIVSCTQKIINEKINKKFEGIMLNNYVIDFSKHSKSRIVSREIKLNYVILIIRNIVQYEFIKNKKVLFNDFIKNKSVIFDFKEDRCVVVTVINEVTKDKFFNGDIIFIREFDNKLSYYLAPQYCCN